MEITRAGVVESQVRKILTCRDAYVSVEAVTGVPWFIIGIMDLREGGGGACTHLHNGDSLKKQTENVPANRPPGPGPFTFIQSAVDALRIKKLDKIERWTLERIAYEFERYNGFGYRKYRKMLSPYLWGATNHQQPGKYVRDGVFDRSVMDKQVGCMALLKALCDAEGIAITSQFGATANPDEPTPASNAKAEDGPDKRVIVGGSAAAVTVTGAIAQTKEATEVARQVKDIAPPWDSYAWPAAILGAALIAAVVLLRRRT